MKTTSPIAMVAASEAERAALKLWVVLSRAYAAIADHAADDVKEHGISISEFGVLELLHHKGPTLLGEIQRRVLVSSGGITFLVDRLVTRGYVERLECPTDRRARYAALTKEGTRFVTSMFPQHAQRIARALSALTTTEQQQLTEALKRLGKAAAGC